MTTDETERITAIRARVGTAPIHAFKDTNDLVFVLARLAQVEAEREALRETVNDSCACVQDGRGAFIAECQEHADIRQRAEAGERELAIARQTLHGRIQGSGDPATMGLLQRAEKAERERDRAKAGIDAWRRHYESGNPMTPAEHDPSKHAVTCARLQPEDDVVIRQMCGTFVYSPTIPCTCGADPNWKLRAEAAEATLAQVTQALRAAAQFIDPQVGRGPDVNGWQNTYDLVQAALAAVPEGTPNV